jgi:hypothetical protein
MKLRWASKPISTDLEIEGLKPPGCPGRFAFNKRRESLLLHINKPVKVFGIKHLCGGKTIKVGDKIFIAIRKAVVIDKEGNILGAYDHLNIKVDKNLSIANNTPICFEGKVGVYFKNRIKYASITEICNIQYIEAMRKKETSTL